MTDTIPADVRTFWMNTALGLKDELVKRGNRIDALERLLAEKDRRIAELEAKLRSADALYSGAVDAIAELDAQVKHWRIQHAECTTSLITEVRKTERLEAQLKAVTP